MFFPMASSRSTQDRFRLKRLGRATAGGISFTHFTAGAAGVAASIARAGPTAQSSFRKAENLARNMQPERPDGTWAPSGSTGPRVEN